MTFKPSIVVSSLLLCLLAAGPSVPGCDRESSGPPPAIPHASGTGSDGAAPAPAAETPQADSAADRLEPAPSESAERLVDASVPTPVAPAEKPAPWLPLADAAPGEWAEYETLEGHRLRYEVTRVTSYEVLTRVTFRESGRTWGEPAIREDDPQVDLLAGEAERRQAHRRVAEETLDGAAGRSWQATLHEAHWSDDDLPYVRRTWVHPQVPYMGTLRMELHGDGRLEARLTLVDYGPR